MKVSLRFFQKSQKKLKSLLEYLKKSVTTLISLHLNFRLSLIVHFNFLIKKWQSIDKIHAAHKRNVRAFVRNSLISLIALFFKFIICVTQSRIELSPSCLRHSTSTKKCVTIWLVVCRLVDLAKMMQVYVFLLFCQGNCNGSTGVNYFIFIGPKMLMPLMLLLFALSHFHPTG